MNTKLFVNLPVKNLATSMTFFEGLGFRFNPQFTDQTAACMIVNDQTCVMLLTEPKFKAFTPNPLCDPRKSTEVLLALSCETRAQVCDLVEKALATGGTKYSEPKNHGFMVQDGFQDPDGHIWELFYMDPEAMKP